MLIIILKNKVPLVHLLLFLHEIPLIYGIKI